MHVSLAIFFYYSVPYPITYTIHNISFPFIAVRRNPLPLLSRALMNLTYLFVSLIYRHFRTCLAQILFIYIPSCSRACETVHADTLYGLIGRQKWKRSKVNIDDSRSPRERFCFLLTGQILRSMKGEASWCCLGSQTAVPQLLSPHMA